MRYVSGDSAFLCKPFLEGRNMNVMHYFLLLAVNNSQRVIQQEHVYGTCLWINGYSGLTVV